MQDYGVLCYYKHFGSVGKGYSVEAAVLDYLTLRRTLTLGNLAAHFDCSVASLVPVVQALESRKSLRWANSRCVSGCSDCAGCDTDSLVPDLTEKTILFSLIRYP